MAPNFSRAPDGSFHLSVQFSRSVVSDSLRPHGLQHARQVIRSTHKPVSPTVTLLHIQHLCPTQWMPIPTPGITHSTLPGACAQLLPLSHTQWTSPFRNTKLFLKSSSCHLYCHSLNLHFPISPLALTAPNVSSCIRSQHGDQQKQVEIFFLHWERLFVYFWLRWVFAAVWEISLVAVRGLLIAVALRVLLFLRSTSSRAPAKQLWPTGLAAPRHVEISWTRDQTCVPCIDRWILNHWATREALASWGFKTAFYGIKFRFLRTQNPTNPSPPLQAAYTNISPFLILPPPPTPRLSSSHFLCLAIECMRTVANTDSRYCYYLPFHKWKSWGTQILLAQQWVDLTIHQSWLQNLSS